MKRKPHPLDHVTDLPSRLAVDMAEAILAEAEIPVYPRGDLEIRILEALRQYHPVPLTPVQVSVMLRHPHERVRTIMTALAVLGTIGRPSRGYYQHIPPP